MAELPSGTVTFLFTDIEGSTRMLHELRDRYGDVLETHARLMRAAFEEHNGNEIDTQGDSFFAAFRTAKDALAAAVSAQKRLAAEPWANGKRPAVRMGMHTGEPSVSGERYLGLAVHRASRICSAAHGGQILLSGTTADLVADELPPGTSLRNLGEHKLKDFERPERVFQVVADGLADAFPPLAAERNSTLEGFSGREYELAQAAEAAIAEPTPRRRRLRGRAAWVAVAAALIVGGAIAAVVAATVGTGDGSSAVPPKSVAFIDPAQNAVVGAVALDGSPSFLVGNSGDAWIANAEDKTLLRVDGKTRKLVKTIGLGAIPRGVASGAGSVWITSDGFGSGPLIEVVPATNDVRVAPRPRCCAGLWFITGDDERLWIASLVSADMTKFDPAARRFGPTLCCSVVVDAIALGEGALWVVERDDQHVARLDADSGAVEATIPIGAPRIQPLNFRHPEVQTAVAAGEGGVWVLDAIEGTVWQIDPIQNEVKRTISVDAGAKAITVGFGSVWVANPVSGLIYRIDPSSGEVIERIKVAERVSGLAPAGGVLWVGVP
jgi:class 3 adenylate cyclase/streptogramin lyase